MLEYTVLIAVDDVQWLDESSRTVLEFAVRRLRTERVPFYALEIARALQRRAPVVGPGEPLPVPPTLAQLVHERVLALPDGVRRLLEIVATLFDRRLATVRELAHEEGLDGAIDDAVAAGVLGARGAWSFSIRCWPPASTPTWAPTGAVRFIAASPFETRATRRERCTERWRQIRPMRGLRTSLTARRRLHERGGRRRPLAATPNEPRT